MFVDLQHANQWTKVASLIVSVLDQCDQSLPRIAIGHAPKTCRMTLQELDGDGIGCRIWLVLFFCRRNCLLQRLLLLYVVIVCYCGVLIFLASSDVLHQQSTMLPTSDSLNWNLCNIPSPKTCPISAHRKPVAFWESQIWLWQSLPRYVKVQRLLEKFTGRRQADFLISKGNEQPQIQPVHGS